MSVKVTGRLSGSLGGELAEPLSRVRVRLYRPAGGQEPGDAHIPLPDDAVERKAAQLLAEVETDDEGAFTADLRDVDGPVEVDVRIARVSGQEGKGKVDARQFSLAVFDPRRQGAAVWDHRIAEKRWCAIRSLFGVRTISGRVTFQGTGQGAGGVRVHAFDADWIQDDSLGSALTDAQGYYRIHYTAAQFRRTPLSPLINVDTPLFTSASGPDVYFRVTTPGGDPLLTESAATGLTAGREDAPACLWVDLEIPRQQPDPKDPGEIDTIPLFSHVGLYAVDPVAGDFDADGLANPEKLAFTGTIPLRGVMPDGLAGQPMEYRFRVAPYGPGGALGAVSDLEAPRLAATQIGSLEFWDFRPATSSWVLTAVPYYANHPASPTVTVHRPAGQGGDTVVSVNRPVKAGGWIEVPRDNDLSVGGLGRFVANTGHLAMLRTDTLTSEHFDLRALVPPVTAGVEVPAAARTGARAFKIFFEAQVVGGGGVSANALDRIAMINVSYTYERHPNWAGSTVTTRGVVSVNVQELVTGGGCQPLDDQVHALFTVYHPFARGGSVSFEGNAPLPAALDLAPELASSGVGDPLGRAVSPAGGHAFPFAAQSPCAYVLWLGATLDLTSGYGRISDAGITDHIAFCKAQPDEDP